MHRKKLLWGAGALAAVFVAAHVFVAVTGKCPLGCLMQGLHQKPVAQTSSPTN